MPEEIDVNKIDANCLRICVAGSRSSGKTALAAIVVKQLRELGLNVEAVFTDAPGEVFEKMMETSDIALAKMVKEEKQIIVFDSGKDIPFTPDMVGKSD